MRHRKTLHRAFRRKATGTALMVIPQPEDENAWTAQDRRKAIFCGTYTVCYFLLGLILATLRHVGVI